MATYYNGNSEIQGELQTLVLMNPGYLYYPDTRQSSQQQQQSGNFVFLDSNNSGTGHIQASNHHQHVNISHAPPPPRAQYIYDPVELVAAPPRKATPFQQGLSLSLSRFGSQAARIPISPTGDDGRTAAHGGGEGGATSSASGMHNMLLNSKYLKATQQVLEEVVNVGKAAIKNFKNVSSGDGGSPPPITGEPATKSGGVAEPTTAERQEIQMKKAKLVNMLDEVDQRYKQYHHQMQTVISWFEHVAGIGAAKTYTSLALQTISKQFRCLKDAILGQIKAASRSLGEDGGLGGGGTAEGGGSRLKFVDNQLRQQRALEQLGMIQHNAWRPQRGLPERSVSVLRAWLFEHFLHPYPKDSDKHMLAKQTGLTRSQVSNWFINARVRLWKPMVEEMYLEETKEQEHNGTEDQKPNQNEQTELNSSTKPDKKNLSRENSTKEFTPKKPENPFINPPNPLMSVSTAVSASSPATGTNFQSPSGFSLLGTLEMNQYSPKKPRNNDGGFTITGTNADFMGGFGGYPIGDQFQQQYSRNGVSLNLSISGNHRNILPNQNIQLGRRTELRDENNYGITNPASSSHSDSMYDSMNIQNRKRFAAQPLSDFVA